MKQKSTSIIKKLYIIFLYLSFFEGLVAIWSIFRIPSEIKNSFLSNFSIQRIIVGIFTLLILLLLLILILDSLDPQKALQFIRSFLLTKLRMKNILLIVRTSIVVIIITSFFITFFYLFPDFQRLAPFLDYDLYFQIIWERSGFFIIWVLLLSIKILILVSISVGEATSKIPILHQLVVISWTIESFFILFLLFAIIINNQNFIEVFKSVVVKTLIFASWCSIWFISSRNEKYQKKTNFPFKLISIWLFVFLISLQFTQWFDKLDTPKINHFNYLASAFLHGELFLTDPPGTYDLTYYNGNWYLPAPPFPAMLMLPVVAIFGVDLVNTTIVSLALSATIPIVIYCILYRLISLSWIKITGTNAIWLLLLFSFGTPIWWLSMDSRVWFFSQVVTVLFCSLAFLVTIREKSPAISGLFLSAAVMSRPNVILLWPALLGIAMQLYKNHNRYSWKQLFKWSFVSAIPIVIAVFILLVYNFIRFGYFFEFGYATLNGATWILENVKEYGLFSFHFLPDNLKLMFLAFPKYLIECNYYLPRGTGISIFFTTPAMIYLFRKLKFSYWAIGCWCSIIFSIIVLSLYSNNGSNQYGYRYMLDFIVPAIMLIAHNAGSKISIPLKIFILSSIAVNYYGTISWFNGPC